MEEEKDSGTNDSSNDRPVIDTRLILDSYKPDTEE